MRRGEIVDAVVGVCQHSARRASRSAGCDDAVAAQLGVIDVTVLAVRPDRYIGLRDDSGDAAVVDAYLDGLVA